jgi:hypothetical protein
LIDEPDRTSQAESLFIDDEELRRRINPKIGRDRFRALIKAAEIEGFPRIRPSWGGRYWPKVRQWLDNDNQVHNHADAGDAQDGPEDFDATSRASTRPQARPPQPALLDGEAGRPRPARLSGPLRSVAAGRGR